VWSDLIPRASDGWVGIAIAAFALATLVQYLTLNLFACLQARRELVRQGLADRLGLFEGDLAPPISILVPAHNEGPTIVQSVRSLMQLRYPSTEIIVVNDGSTDETLETLIRAFGLRPSWRTTRARVSQGRTRGVYSSPDHPALVVLDTINGGKAQALNVALAFSRHPLFLAIDADSVLERDTLLELALPFYLDASVAVTGGVVRPANGSSIEAGRVLSARLSRHHLARFQTVEYLRGMLGGRMGWDQLDCLYIVSGALGLFSREAVMQVGGYRSETLGEDMELIMRVQRWARRKGRRRAVRFVPSAVAWTEVPERIASLARQRARWHQGLAESLWLNRGLVLSARFSPRHAAAFLSQLLIELLGPFWELVGLLLLSVQIATGRLDWPFAAIYFGVFVLGGTINSLFGIAIETVMCPRYPRSRDSVLLILYAVLENFGYRQLTAWWRVQGLWNALRRRHEWGAMARLGHAATVEAVEAEERRAA
jgi:cellulose synthase/poly-beta-1,6-N-acetylglucosamine synthase-like glycosyltransferase